MTFEGDAFAAIAAGSSLVVGTVSADGEPRAHRALAAWVCDDAEPRRIRFVMSGDDPDLGDHLTSRSVALTGADIVTYRSVQFKGRPVSVETPTARDLEIAVDHSETFFDAVQRVDGNPIEGLRRMLPRRMLSVEMVVDSVYDQTPGPRAGGELEHPPGGSLDGAGAGVDDPDVVP